MPERITVAKRLIDAGLRPRRAHAVITALAEGLLHPAAERPGIPAALRVEDADAFIAEMAALEVRAERRGPPNAVDVAALRTSLGLTQDAFAARFGLDLATLRNWEQGRTRPDGPARTLLAVIARRPEAVDAALAEG